MPAEAPRLIIDQLARHPDELCASLAAGLEWVGHRRQRLGLDALLVVGPEHGRVFRQAGWDRARVCRELFERSHSPAGELVRGAGGIAEGIEAKWVSDPDMPVAKFAAPERILLAHAGGDAGLFSMVYGGWVSGEIGSEPVTRSRRAVAMRILDPTRETTPAGRPLCAKRLRRRRARRRSRCSTSASRAATCSSTSSSG